MKKIKYISMVGAMLAAFTMVSCSDFLEAENKSAGGSADDFFSKNPAKLLNSAYANLKTTAFNTDLYSRGTDLYIHTRSKTPTEFDQYTLTPNNGTTTSLYSNLYKTINYSNGVIAYADESSSEAAEARFLRNYGYYLLTQHFGSVPYITKYINDPEKYYPRTPLDEVYTSMIADLTSLYDHAALEDQDHSGHASKQAVAALLSKVYLAAGWDLQTTLNDAAKGTYTVNSTEYFTQSAAWAEKAINGIQLTMSFEDKWSPFNEGNTEEIWSVQYDRDSYPGDVTEGGHNMQGTFGGYYGAYNASGMKGVSSEDSQSEKSMYLFEKGDQRYEATYMTTMYNSEKDDNNKAAWGTQGYFAYYNVPAAKLATMPICKKYFPYWYTEAEVEAYMESHKDQLIANSKVYANGDVRIALLQLPEVTTWVYTYNERTEEVTLTKSKVDLATYNAQTSNGVCVKKFDDPNTEFAESNNLDYRDIVVFHVSDMYLVAAEAYFMAGQNAQALAKINAVRSRAGLAALGSFSDYAPQYNVSSSYTETPLDLILDERARELYAEGHRWMDLRRTKQLVRYNVEFSPYIANASAMANNQGEIKWYRPIPTNEISTNTGITNEDQNPGY